MEKALSSLDSIAVEGLEVVALVGPSNPRGGELAAAAATCRTSVRLLRNPHNIPELMEWCDLALTAAGGTIWELAYCRVPSIVVAVAEGQRGAIEALERRGACCSLGCGKRLAAEEISRAISALCGDLPRRAALGSALAATVDGRGAQRVLETMAEVGANDVGARSPNHAPAGRVGSPCPSPGDPA